MLKKRIIPCLDIMNGRTVKGINFVEIRDAGDPIELAKKYIRDGADELVFLDITATQEKRKTLKELVEKIAAEINVPFTVGGGINSLDDAKLIIRAGADKVSLNSAVVKRPGLIAEIADHYGRQCVVVAIDTKFDGTENKVYVHGGKTATNLNTFDWVNKAESLGAGEILLTSMDQDGTKKGFDLPLLKEVSSMVNIPVIASGGAGAKEHFAEVFRQTQVSAALAASIFHYDQIPIPELKNYLKTQKIPIR